MPVHTASLPVQASGYCEELLRLHKESVDKEAILATLRTGWKALKSSLPRTKRPPSLTAPAGVHLPARQQAAGAGNQLMGALGQGGVRVQRARVKSPASMAAKGITDQSPVPDDLLGMQFYAKGPEDVARAVKRLRQSGATVSGVAPHVRPGYHGVNIKGTYQNTPYELQASPGILSNIGQQMEHTLGYKQRTEAPNATWFDKWVGKRVAPRLVKDPSWMSDVGLQDQLRFLSAVTG